MQDILSYVVENQRQIYIGETFCCSMKEQALESLGLNKKEIAVYLVNLQLGSSLVQNIAKRANLNRTSTYDILASLERRGFVSYTVTGGKRYYQATDPRKLIGLLKEKESLVRKALPDLVALKESVAEKPNVEVYIGINGIKSVFEDVLRTGEDISVLASKEHVFDFLKYYIPHFVDRRVKLGIKARLILDVPPHDPKAEYRLIKKKLKTIMYLYGGKIAMMSLGKAPMGILIDEANFYESHLEMFNLLWDALPKP